MIKLTITISATARDRSVVTQISSTVEKAPNLIARPWSLELLPHYCTE